jgi:hypothetical protein
VCPADSGHLLPCREQRCHFLCANVQAWWARSRMRWALHRLRLRSLQHLERALSTCTKPRCPPSSPSSSCPTSRLRRTRCAAQPAAFVLAAFTPSHQPSHGMVLRAVLVLESWHAVMQGLIKDDKKVEQLAYDQLKAQNPQPKAEPIVEQAAKTVGVPFISSLVLELLVKRPAGMAADGCTHHSCTACKACRHMTCGLYSQARLEHCRPRRPVRMLKWQRRTQLARRR